MSTTINPPEVHEPASPPPTPPRETGSASRVIAILTIALGVAVVIGALTSATFSTVAAAAVRTETRTVDAAGVRELDVDVDAASLRVDFADVDEATLEVTSGRGADEWTLERDGDELSVSSPERFWFGWGLANETRATLTLPRALEGTTLDASLGLSAGELVVDGAFGELEMDVDAGSLTVSGSARALSADLSAGGADIELADVREAEFQLSAGTVDSRLTGVPPRTVLIDVSAGSLDLTLPSETYDVRSDVSAGDFENGLRTEAGSENQVVVTVSAGTVTVDSAR